jgi:hypothetical protein
VGFLLSDAVFHRSLPSNSHSAEYSAVALFGFCLSRHDACLAMAIENDAQGTGGASGAVGDGHGATVCIALTRAQVELVARASGAIGGSSLNLVLSRLVSSVDLSADPLEGLRGARFESGELSRSLARGLVILGYFIERGGELGVTDVARHLGMNPSTVHRYIATLTELSLLEQEPETRRYRLMG